MGRYVHRGQRIWQREKMNTGKMRIRTVRLANFIESSQAESPTSHFERGTTV
jgi:hypothetical protein